MSASLARLGKYLERLEGARVLTRYPNWASGLRCACGAIGDQWTLGSAYGLSDPTRDTPTLCEACLSARIDWTRGPVIMQGWESWVLVGPCASAVRS